MSAKEGEVTAGKYYLIEVPNFNDAAGGGDPPMSSYLRLGAVKDVSIAGSPSAPKESGEDLAGLVTGFVDDTRKRDGCDSTGEFTFTPEAARLAESAKLHTKGGWRDHSDGNRITTTRGDKVEVIRGNYKLVVLGRTDNIEEAASSDMSGGHVADGGITIRSMNSVEWVQNYDGTWKVVEVAIRGDVTSMYHGDVRDFYFGIIKESTTGSEAPRKNQENPKIVDRTWAESIASNTGSEVLRVPAISEEVWAAEMTSLTDATNVTETLNVSGAITSTTTAGSTTETTTISGAVTSTSTFGSVTETSTIDTITETSTVGTRTETSKVDTATSTSTVGTSTDVSTIGTSTTVTTIGTATDVTMAGSMLNAALMGTSTDVTLGGTQTNLTIVGGMLEFLLGFRTSIDISGNLEVVLPISFTLTGMDAEYSIYKEIGAAYINIGLGAGVAVAAAATGALGGIAALTGSVTSAVASAAAAGGSGGSGS